MLLLSLFAFMQKETKNQGLHNRSAHPSGQRHHIA
jgi:hypothetical protein